MNILKSIIETTIVMIIVFLLSILIYGYLYYNGVKQERPLDKTVEYIQSHEDYIEIEEISPYFLNAIVAIEDRRFFKHSGLDVIGIFRAVVSNIRAGEIVQGGSTISQQLAKNLFFTNQRTLTRKVAEMFMTLDIEKNFDKEEILEIYSNVIYLGKGNYVLYSASKEYFDKDPIKLDLNESAFIAGLTQSPTAYTNDIELGFERQREVLKALEDFERVKFDNIATQ
ncbi:hypothetical protein AN643_00605 [Candidatus Epulonipiscioides saccharophilum]|nr:hypothetical protein AN643_00605 [Epulopiscium sp. SCG-B10WGA-EpuloB]